MSVDLAVRTDELARELMRFPKWTLAAQLAQLKMRDARDYGVPALHRRRRAALEEVAASARDLEAADAARRGERARQRRFAEAERKLRTATRETRDADV